MQSIIILLMFFFTVTVLPASGQQQGSQSLLTDNFQKTQSFYDIPVSIQVEKASLNEIFRQLEKQMSLRFLYNPKVIRKSEHRLDLSLTEVSVADVLQEVALQTGLTFRQVNGSISIGVDKLREPEPEMLEEALQQTITGTVFDAQTGEALPGVNILIQGTTTGTNTDADGNFELEVSDLEQILVVSYVGYERLEIPIDGRTQLNIELNPLVVAGDELLVVGYGTQIKEETSSSISSVDTRSFENVTLGNAATALQGTVSGLRVQRSGGQPGAEPTIVMRGGASILNPDGAEPLYVVDGITRPSLAGINSSDIESMQVLKDASATAIYGARAANGVVIVNTKRGEAGETQFNYNYSAEFSQLREKLPMLNGRDHIFYGRIGAARRLLGNQEGIWQGTTQGFIQQWFAENPGRLDSFTNQHGSWFTGNDLTNQTSFTTQYLSTENEHLLQEGWQSMLDPLDSSREIIFKETDWQDVIFRTGVTHDHHLNVSGGTETATFSAGLGYSTIDGTAIQTNYDRITANLRGNLQFRENVSISSSLNFSRETDNQVFSNNALFERSISLAPTAKRTFQDGTPAHYRRSLGNPEYYMPRTDVDNLTDSYSLRAQLNWEILRGLSFEPSASLYTRTGEETTFLQSYFDDGSLIQTRNSTGLYTNIAQQEYDAVLNFDRMVAPYHNVEAILGSSYFERSSKNLEASGSGAATDLIPTLNAAADPSSISSFRSDRKIIGFFSRINYNYNRRYLLTLTSRYDGASNLGPANRWGFFPSVSAGWNLHNEDFWASPFRMSTLKLRASYGTSGNLGALGDFTAQGGYSVGNTYAGQPAIEYSTIANEDLRWESSTTLNLGVETGFLGDRIEFQTEVYRRVTDDLVMSLTLPASTGFSSILTNLGSLENRGWEMELGANILRTADINWNLSLNASYNKNTILSLPENQNENNRIGGFQVWDEELGELVWKGGLQEGGTMGELYGYRQIGVYATDEEAAQGPLNTMRLTGVQENYAGDSEFYDADGDGFITPADRRYMGNIFPDWTGGISTTVSYRNWSLYLRGDYALGHTIYNYVRTQADGTFAGNLNPTTNVLRSWMEPGDQTNVPRFYSAEQIGGGAYWMGDPRNAVGNGSGNSIFYESADYFSVREISLMFNAPQSWLAYSGMSGLGLNVTVENVHYFTGYFGLSPEEGGMDRGRYPIPRNISISANISF